MATVQCENATRPGERIQRRHLPCRVAVQSVREDTTIVTRGLRIGIAGKDPVVRSVFGVAVALNDSGHGVVVEVSS